jgi:hypothetical protein
MLCFYGNEKGCLMTNSTDASPDRGALVYRYHERLYRLALLTTGNADTAGASLQRAYRELPATSADHEALLIRALLPNRPPRQRWRWNAGQGDLARSTLDRASADALLLALARLAPAERLAIGLAYLSGCAPGEIEAQIGQLPSGSAPADLLARFRAEAARALDRVPEEADTETLRQLDRWLDGRLPEADSIALRRAALEQPAMRDLRDGMIATRELLPRALPALFAVAPPHALTARLLKIAQGRQRTIVPDLRARRAQGALALGVLLLTAAIILLPSLAARGGGAATGRAPDIDALIDSAIHRFDRPPLDAGVLHEQYLVADGRAEYLIERWYDYAAPNRLAISVKREDRNGPPLMQVTSDGTSLVQFRNLYGGPNGQRASDVQVSASEARAVLPLLRGQPTVASFGQERGAPGDLGPLYLAQARAAAASLLGTTTMLGRQAFLLTYRTEQPPALEPSDTAQPAQVVLAIDSETYALLDVSLIAEGAAESSARHPIQARLLEVLEDVPDEQFRLPTSAEVGQHSGITSVRFPFIADDQVISLEDAARRAPRALLAPRQLPDERMRGLAVAVDNRRDGQDVILVYEGEFQNLLVLPGSLSNDAPRRGQELSAGDFRYQLVRGRDFGSGLAAIVYRPDAPDEPLTMILNDEYATSEEREATLQRLIASLTPVDTQSLPALQRNFQAYDAAAGGS